MLDAYFILDKAHAGDKMKIADFGCGASGHFVFPSASVVGKNGKVYAIDILKTNLEAVSRRARRENFENIETIWSDLEIFNATKVESGSLDIGLVINTLFHSKKRIEMLRECIRMIKRGGRLVVAEWLSVAVPLGPPAELRVSKDSLMRVAGKLELQLETEFEAGPYHYGLIFVKL